MSAAGELVKVGRSYTRARRYPWVIGKIQGWTIPLGPFTATQLGVLIGGMFLLVQTFSVWSALGPFALVVLVLPFAATWAVRHAKIEGRAPLRALAGYASLLAEPACGRIGTRLARDLRPVALTGTVRLSAPPPAPEPAPRRQQQPAASEPTAGPAPASRAGSAVRDMRRVAAHGAAQTAAPPASMAAPAGPRPAGQHPARQTLSGRAARPAPTALQSLLAASRHGNES